MLADVFQLLVEIACGCWADHNINVQKADILDQSRTFVLGARTGYRLWAYVCCGCVCVCVSACVYLQA